MNNLQYARVGAVRSKNSRFHASNVEVNTSSASDALIAQEATLNNNHLNNISCK
ncbi:hypothetical protein [Maribacter forsetii]|uniref:hypothetical protein n=1 Tax=Maribacter forsetii TaxID=444515 RepID=UPI0012FB05E9|nr:hypothetical protein [Maribacter forsetii]